MSDEKELKPCPFCGSNRARLFLETDSDAHLCVAGDYCFISVKCWECRKSTLRGHCHRDDSGGQERQRVISEWNSRPLEDRLQQQLTAARERIEALEDFARFMCETWSMIDKWAYTPDKHIFKYPVIQGTRQQIKLAQIGQQNYKKERIPIAIKFLSEAALNEDKSTKEGI